MQKKTPDAPVPQDNLSYKFPVSIKGVVLNQEGKVVLLKNERNEWELPGGKLELGETPEDCVIREIKEELDINSKIGLILDSWVYHIYQGVDVLIVTYGCYPNQPFSKVAHSREHKDVGLFSLEEAMILNMPEGYKKSIRNWHSSQNRISAFSATLCIRSPANL